MTRLKCIIAYKSFSRAAKPFRAILSVYIRRHTLHINLGLSFVQRFTTFRAHKTQGTMKNIVDLSNTCCIYKSATK